MWKRTPDNGWEALISQSGQISGSSKRSSQGISMKRSNLLSASVGTNFCPDKKPKICENSNQASPPIIGGPPGIYCRMSDLRLKCHFGTHSYAYFWPHFVRIRIGRSPNFVQNPYASRIGHSYRRSLGLIVKFFDAVDGSWVVLDSISPQLRTLGIGHRTNFGPFVRSFGSDIR